VTSEPEGKYMNWTGLAADAWDPSGGDDVKEDVAFIQRVIEQGGAPALDVGCGTGRLLLRYLAAGLDVEGLDSSEDMLAICRVKGDQQGLKPTLYHASMHTMELPRHYRTIFTPCGSFVLLIDRDQAWDALKRMHDHLEPGGTLILTSFWPFDSGEPLSEKPLGEMGEWGKLWSQDQPDGSQIVQTLMIEKIDRAEQLLLAKRRYQLMRGGEVIKEEVFASCERWYFKHEMELMMKLVGFREVRIVGNWTDEPFEDRHGTMVTLATK
jgi:ubiquinone/menaquinone biosynthesis C-methylase UbiE